MQHAKAVNQLRAGPRGGITQISFVSTKTTTIVNVHRRYKLTDIDESPGRALAKLFRFIGEGDFYNAGNVPRRGGDPDGVGGY